MNEQIDEIAFEAGCHRHKYWDPKHPDLEGYIISQEALDKFAELIVRECMELTRWKEFDMSVEQRICLSVYQDIKEHFGVE